MILPDPMGLSWQDWADTVVGFNSSLRNTVPQDGPWREFARWFAQAEPKAPLESFFDTWQAWAAAVRFVLQD